MQHTVLAAGLLAGAVAAPVAVAGGQSAPPVVKTPGGVSIAINQYVKDAVHFSPGHLTVASGSKVTFKHTTKEDEPHTVTVASAEDLPKTAADLDRCKPCEVARGHLKNPKKENSAIAHVILNKGPLGLDEPGDSVALKPKKSVTVVISAPAGTTLRFVCAIHPWMQGSITVT
jgi:plastocyanin